MLRVKLPVVLHQWYWLERLPARLLDEFVFQLGHIKDFKSGICCFFLFNTQH